MVIGYEILQYPGIISGTFCLEDIAMSTIGFGIGILVGIKSNEQHKS